MCFGSLGLSVIDRPLVFLGLSLPSSLPLVLLGCPCSSSLSDSSLCLSPLGVLSSLILALLLLGLPLKGEVGVSSFLIPLVLFAVLVFGDSGVSTSLLPPFPLERLLPTLPSLLLLPTLPGLCSSFLGLFLS